MIVSFKNIVRVLSSLLCLVLVLSSGPAWSQDEAGITATSLMLEETEDSGTITLEGPVAVDYRGDHLSADSAVITLGGSLEDFESAISRIELTGHVQFSGRDGSGASASRATYYASGNGIVLQGGVRFSDDGLTATAGSADYSITTRHLVLSGNVSISEGDISANGGMLEYDLRSRSGHLSGNVEVTYMTDTVLFGSEAIDSVVLYSESLTVSVAENRLTSPASDQSRITLVAGNFSLSSDTIEFTGTEDGLNSITVNGNVHLEGPRIESLSADSLSLSTGDRVLHAGGNVSFSIMNQEGTAESIEVRFAEGWDMSMVEGNVGGLIEDIDPDDNSENTE